MLLVPAAMVTLVVVVAQPAAPLKLVEPALEVRLSAVAAATTEALPKLSCDCTVTAPEQTPAVTVCAVVVTTSLLGAAGLIVSVWLAPVRPVAATVAGAVPDFVFLK